MAMDNELCGILTVGLQKEHASHDLYLEAAAKVWHPLGKKMFERLAEEETRHEQLLKSWSAKGACPVSSEAPEMDKDFMARARATIKSTVKPSSGDLEALQMGQDLERKSIAFYLDAAAKAPDQPSKDLFLRLKGEEDKHLALLTDLLGYMSNPNLWSVRDEHANFDS